MRGKKYFTHKVLRKDYRFVNFSSWDGDILESIKHFHKECKVYPNVLFASPKTYKKINWKAMNHTEPLIDPGKVKHMNNYKYPYEPIDIISTKDFCLKLCTDSNAGKGKIILIHDNAPDFGFESDYIVECETRMVNPISFLLEESLPVNQKIILFYENIFKVSIPIEVQRIISYKSARFLYNSKEYSTDSPIGWIDKFDYENDIFQDDFSFQKEGYIPLLYGDDVFVFYDLNKNHYIFAGLGYVSGGYKTLIILLDNYNKINK